jgi:hypothetical protein
MDQPGNQISSQDPYQGRCLRCPEFRWSIVIIDNIGVDTRPNNLVARSIRYISNIPTLFHSVVCFSEYDDESLCMSMFGMGPVNQCLAEKIHDPPANIKTAMTITIE